MPPATYEDLLRVPDHLVAEIIDGELFTSPRPAPPHANALTGLTAALRLAFDHGRGGPGGWRILVEPELHLHADVVVPDIAGWHRERLPVLPDAAAIAVTPNWVCEIVSPSTVRLDRGKKLAIYAREGIAHVWMVDPRLRAMEVLQLASPRWRHLATARGFDPVALTPFQAMPLHLTDLWDRPLSGPPASVAR